MTTRQPFNVRVTRVIQRDLECSACRATIETGVRLLADADRPTVHFLFCRRCCDRIGRVGRSIGHMPKETNT